MESRRRSGADLTLEAFGPPVRDALAAILLYKSVFIGEWFDALVRQEADPKVRDALLQMSRETLREAIEATAAMRAWEDISPHAEFGWSGECHAVVTEERVRLSELLTQKARTDPSIRRDTSGADAPDA